MSGYLHLTNTVQYKLIKILKTDTLREYLKSTGLFT